MANGDEQVDVKESTLQEMEDSGTPCSSFFQQKGAIDHKDYLRLKNREKEVVVQYKAASKIQAVWRGYLIRENMKILHRCATKIQGLMRGALARKRWRAKILERLETLRMEKLNKAATKAWIRGYLSRKNCFDFKKYKELVRKNSELLQSIQTINELEALLTKELKVNPKEEEIQQPSDESTIESLRVKFGSFSSLGSSSSRKSMASETGTLDGLVKTSFNELSNSLSKCRIEELLTYVATSASDPLRNHQGASTSSIRKTSSRGANMRVKDSLDDLFPEFPEEGLVKPDPEKVEALKKAIRLLREKIKNENRRRLLKQHYLLRTKTCPGVYSDIYSNELTDIEKELKAVKFWNQENSPEKTVEYRFKKLGNGDQKHPGRTDKQNEIRRGVTYNKDRETYNGKNLRRQLSLRKRLPNCSITNNGDPLTSNGGSDTDVNTTENSEELYSTTAEDGYCDSRA